MDRSQVLDTSTAARDVVLERLRAMTVAQRAAITAALIRDVDRLAVAGLRLRHPDATEDEIQIRLAATRMDRDLLHRAYAGRVPDDV